MKIQGPVGTLAAALLMYASLAACGNSDGASADSAGGVPDEVPAAFQEAESNVKTYLSNPRLEVDPVPTPPEKGLKVASVTCSVPSCHPGQFADAVDALGWNNTEETYDLTVGPSSFVSAVRRALQSEPDALAILFAYPPDMISKEIQQAQDEGVELVDIGSALDAPPEGFIACVSCKPSLEAYGRAQAEFVSADAGGPVSVGIAGDSATDATRITGETAADELVRISPKMDVHVIDVSFSRTPQANAQAVVGALQRNPKIEYLLFQSPDLMTGVAQALSASGLADKVEVLCIDPSGETHISMVEHGLPDAWVGGDGPAYWWRAADAIVRNQVGQEVDPAPGQAVRVITKGNAESEMYAPADYRLAYRQAWGVDK